MNKKLLFSVMSLAALAACTNDDFDSQQIAEQTSPVQFELVNDNASMRASMDGSDVIFSAEDGDLFTLYHGVAYAEPAPITGYQNATYKAVKPEGGVSKLTTPSMILPGSAVMVWPADTTFRVKSSDNISIFIPKDLPKDKIENHIPYVSDLIQIADYAKYDEDPANAYNNAGYNRTYPLHMRPMASQLTLNADYDGTDETIAELYKDGKDGLTGEDAVDPIEVTSVELLTDPSGSTKFTESIELAFATPTAPQGTNWTSVQNNAWKQVTDVKRDANGPVAATSVDKLTTKNINGLQSAKFLILPQKTITSGVEKAAVVVKTTYGDVLIAKKSDYTASKYEDEDYEAAWYRYVSEAKAATAEENASVPGTGDYAKKHKVVAKNPGLGMEQTINFFADYKADAESKVRGEYMGVSTSRFVKVDLSKLDMSNLHIKTDKQLRNAAKVWKKMNLAPVTVYLDGDKTTGEFEISQKTIKVINDINDAAAKETKKRAFTVMPCTEANETCTDIVITGGGDIQDIAFIKKNGTATANVVLADEATAWKWNGTTDETKKVLVGEGVKRIFNKGTMVNDKTATLAIWSVTYAPTTNVMTVGTQNTDLIFENDGTWDITGSTVLNVRIDVSNYGTVNIAEGAQYRQDGPAVIFHNLATTRPQRFLADGAKANVGVVNNSGVFATVNSGKIYNYGGLIEHLTKNAKTYITKNQNGAGFASPFGGANRMGRINLKYENKDEDNISISASAPITEGFVSITITEKDGEKDLKTSLVENSFVNYIIVNGGVEKISDLDTKIKYVEINQPGKEMVWNLDAAASYTGLIVLSPVNIKLGQTISADATYLGDEMYVGGKFNNTTTEWDAYYGNTSGNVATKYITYK